nr:hypothetical protein [Candidatus Sigynarchaeota archaeon]
METVDTNTVTPATSNCLVKIGDRIWRGLTMQGKQPGFLSFKSVHFVKTEKGTFMAHVLKGKHTWGREGDWTISDGDKKGGIVAFLPAKYAPVKLETFAFVVTGVSKNGKSVFIKPDETATLKNFIETRDFHGITVVWPWEEAAKNFHDLPACN